MCGILGFYHLDGESVEASRNEIFALRDMLRHRGPDSDGYLESPDRSWALAHTRLRILDLSARGHQPMSTPDGRVHLCYNGEIYNYRRLQEHLRERGVDFLSTSDTEVILHLYREYGTDCFKMLEGMFALIIVDEERHQAVIARDPVGKKPLYYALLGRTMVAASDPGVISRDPRYQRGVCPEGLYHVLAMGGVRAPHSLFRDIYKLEPGAFRVVDRAFAVPAAGTRYFDFHLTRRADLVAGEEAIDTLDDLLDKSVQKRLISDVPFGVFLSGGIDSALIAYYMSRHTDRVNTFSIDMKESDASKRETTIASELAKLFNTNHHTMDLDTAEYIRILDEVVLPNSTPGMTESVLLARLSEMARAAGVIVIETGEGADELFMGYNGYLSYLGEGMAKVRKFERLGPFLPAALRVARALAPDARRDRRAYLADHLEMASNGLVLRDFLYEPFMSYQAERIVRKRLGARVGENKFAMLNRYLRSRVGDPRAYSDSALSVLWNASFRWADLLLNRIDNFTMTSGIEGRAPMLDIDVMNFALSMADNLKERDGVAKYALRQIVKRHISPDHAALPKVGFGGGGRNLLNPEVRAFLRGKLGASYSYRHEPLMRVDDLDDAFQLFTLVSYHVWFDTWM